MRGCSLNVELWSPFLDLGGHFRFGGSVQETLSDEHPGNIALCCRSSLDLLCSEMHNIAPCRSPVQRDTVVHDPHAEVSSFWNRT